MKNGRKRSSRRRRATPTIYVSGHKSRFSQWKRDLCRAHLRNKKGYVYLQWRDGDEIRSFYLGKAPRGFSHKAADQVTPAPRPRASSSRRDR